MFQFVWANHWGCWFFAFIFSIHLNSNYDEMIAHKLEFVFLVKRSEVVSFDCCFSVLNIFVLSRVNGYSYYYIFAIQTVWLLSLSLSLAFIPPSQFLKSDIHFLLGFITLHFQIVADSPSLLPKLFAWHEKYFYICKYKLNIILFIGHMCIIYLITPRIPHAWIYRTHTVYTECQQQNILILMQYFAWMRHTCTVHKHKYFGKKFLVSHFMHTRFDGFSATTSMNVWI